MARILIIDDDQDILRLLEFALKRAGHEVLISTDGSQGLAQVEAYRPDLVVADVMMPKMTGYEFCRQVRTRPDLTDMPVIMFSARFQPIDKQTALNAGATDYLPKSVSPEVLVKRIHELLPADKIAAAHKAIGFFSLRGGCGVTTLAVNTAVALAVTQKAKPALIDLAPLGGHAAVMLGLRPTSSVVRALSAGNNLSLDSLRPHFIEHIAGVQLLASDLNPEYQLAANHPLERLATVLKPAFRFTIFDMPRRVLTPAYSALLQQLDKVVVILSPDVPSLQSTAITLQSLAQLGVSKSKIELVVNQVVAVGALPLETIQHAVKRPMAAGIPYEPEMVKAVNSGKPLLLNNPKCAGAVAIARLAGMLLN
ncbi:MAG: response regulator [Chloroflexota bacterium]